jgi:hypothetical protein
VALIHSWQLTHEENRTMKTILLSTTAALLFSTVAFAGIPALDDVLTKTADQGYVQLVKDGGDDSSGGGDNSGSGGGDSRDDNGGSDSRDDNGGDRGHSGRGDNDRDDDNDRGDGRHGGRADRDNSRDDNPAASGRRKPRIPGGSGCDDPGDVAEHAACRAQ